MSESIPTVPADALTAAADESSVRQRVRYETPTETAGLKLMPIPQAASGMGAVLHSLDCGLREMGPQRMLKGWLTINQKGGFDCPSCAWADPAGKRHAIEFCENGAKAMADDGTRKRVTREFFARYSVEK